MSLDRKREAHINLLNKITLQYLAPNVCQGRNRKMFRGNARVYFGGSPDLEAMEDPDHIMQALEHSVGVVTIGRYDILRRIVQPIDVRMLEEISKTEKLLSELGHSQLVESDDRNTMDCTVPIQEKGTKDAAAPVVDNGIPEGMKYSMNPLHRGRALIFCNVNVEGKQTLSGYHKDASELKILFGKLGFQCDVLDDAREGRMLHALDELRREDHSNNSAFICCFLSHGNRKAFSRNDPNADKSNENFIYSADGREIYIEDVMNKFSAQNCPTLNGKPKWFIVQACRGTQDLNGHEVAATSPFTPGCIPNFADTLLLNATVQDSKSWVSPQNGSRLIQSLCKLLRKYHQTLDVMTICTFVCGDVADMGPQDRKQMPEIRSTLRKILYLR